MKIKSRVMFLLFGMAGALTLAACGGGGGGGTTATTSFPSSVGVDLSEASSSGLENINFSTAKAGIPEGGTMSAPITTSTNMGDLVVKLADHVFSGVATAMNDMLTATSTQVSGTAFGGTLKIDFSDYGYDINGDGTNDPCSGTAGMATGEVACFRAWFNDARLMMGFIGTVPDTTAGTSGEGKAVISPTLVADPAAMEHLGMGTVMTYLEWTNTEASVNLFDGYSSGVMMNAAGDQQVDLTVGRIVADATTTGGTEKMTLQTAAFFMATPFVVPVPQAGGGTLPITVDQILFNSQYLVGGTYLVFENDFLFEGAEVATGNPEVNNVPLCGKISTGNPASAGDPIDVTLCEGEGLSLTGLAYPTLAATDASKTQFPAASVFPETPTF